MNLTDLRYFLLVARAGSFSRGAELAHVSPPAISKAIQRLEDDLTTALFFRTTRHVTLTSAGHLLVERGHRICREVDDTRSALDELSGTLRGALRVAANEVLSAEVIPRALAELVDEAELVIPELFEMLPQSINTRLADGELDVGFTIGGSATPQVACEVIGQSRGVMVCGLDHPLYKRGRAGKRALLEHPSVVPRFWGQAALPSLDQFDDVRYPRRIGATIELLQSAIELALTGRFLLYVPKISVSRHLENGTLRALTGLSDTPSFELQMLTRRGPVQKPATHRIAEIVKKLVRNAA